MTTDPRVFSIVARYEEAADAGEVPSVADLCADAPELIPVVEDALRQLRPVAVAVAPPAGPLAPDGYELFEEVGRGGMGVVHRAHHHPLDRELAVKFLLPRFAAGSPAARRFVDEARIAARLQHPGIPAVHEVGTLPDGRPFLAMKLIRGRTLAALLKEEGHGGARWVGVFEAVCQAVGAAHAAGYIHRDLKPANVMVGAFGEVQVMDWGLAKRVGATIGTGTVSTEEPDADADPNETVDAAGGAAMDTDASRAGDVKGTLLYMPPEQARGEVEVLDRRADVFALGAILCELLTGRPPLGGMDRVQVHALAMLGRFDDAFARLDGCGEDAALVGLAKRCLSADPAERPPDATAVATEVAAHRADAEARAKRAEVARAEAAVQAAERAKRGRLLRWATAAVVGVLVIGTAVSIAFGFDANTQAGVARGEKKNADDSRALAVQETEVATRERNDAVTARGKEAKANERSERALAKALFGPIKVSTQSLDGYEADALWELAALRDGSVPELLLDEATRTPAAALKFRHRPAHVYHAAVGLDAARRERAERLVSARGRDPQLRQHLTAVLAHVRRPGDDADPILRAINNGPGGFSTPDVGAVLDHLEASADRLTPRQSADHLLVLLNRSRSADSGVRSRLVAALRESVSRSSDEDRATLAAAAADRVWQASPPGGGNPLPLAEEFAAVAGRPPSAKGVELATAVADKMLTLLPAALDNSILVNTAEAFTVVCDLLPPAEAGKKCEAAAAVILRALDQPVQPADVQRIGVAVGMLAGRMPAAEARRCCERVAKAAEAVLAKGGVALAPATGEFKLSPLDTPDGGANARSPAVAALLAMGDWLPDGQVEALLSYLLATDPISDRPMQRRFDRLLAGLPRSQAVRHADRLTALLEKDGAGYFDHYCRGLLRLASSLSAERVQAVADRLLRALPGVRNGGQQNHMRGLLLALAGRLPPAKAGEIADAVLPPLTPVMRTFQGPSLAHTFAGPWAATASNLPAARAGEVAASLLDSLNFPRTLGQVGAPDGCGEVAEGLTEATARLPADRAAEMRCQAADILVGHLATLDEWSQHHPSVLRGQAAVACGLSADHQRAHKHPDGTAAVAGGLFFPDALPKPRPLPPQKLVELLKHPLCVGQARRVILDALEFTYDRPFADLWAFVAFADAHPELKLDLLTPPKRPAK